MQAWSLPSVPKALVFDLDSTLYTHAEYQSAQVSSLVARLARERGETVEATSAAIEAAKAGRRAAGRREGSLGSLFLELGIPIETSVEWRDQLIHPRDWLAPDARLADCLARLRPSLRLALVTNNTSSIGWESLAALGVEASFELVVGLDDSLRSKPDPASFSLALARLGLPGNACVSVGDRHEIDIEPALGLGMGAILVAGVEEVYELPFFLGIPA